ncbi:MAG: CIA30 family protein [Candidatus Sericytochromatia bacterium]
MRYLLDDFQDPARSRFGTEWLPFTDEVMGGSSTVLAQRVEVDGHPCLRLQGEITQPEGFIQAALPLVHSRYLFDARHFEGVHLVCRSDQPQGYFIHVRTKELSMPWQHYRMAVFPTPEWAVHQLPFSAFIPVSTGHEINLERLTRIGVVAGQRAFHADLLVAEIGFYGPSDSAA